MLTIELETEATTVAKDEREGLFPCRMLTTMLDTIAQGVADTMAALHDGTIATFQFIGRQVLGTIELLGKVVAYII